MVSVTELGQRTVDYLRKHVFSDRADYVENNDILVAERYVDFEATQTGLATVDRSWVRDRVLDWIRDSEEYVVIDIAAGFGSGYAHQLSQQFPHAQLFMTDNFNVGGIEGSKSQFAKFPQDLVFTKKSCIGTPEEHMNYMLQANGYRNIRYIDRALTVGGTGTQFPELEKVTKGRRVLVTGICNPADLGLVTAREAAYHGAEECYIVPAGLECLTPDKAADFFKG